MGNRKLVSNEKGLAQNVSEVVSDKASRSPTTRSNSPPAKEGCPKGGVVDSYSANTGQLAEKTISSSFPTKTVARSKLATFCNVASGDRKGQYNIRMKQQGGICFEWIDGNARNVEIVDYD